MVATVTWRVALVIMEVAAAAASCRPKVLFELLQSSDWLGCFSHRGSDLLDSRSKNLSCGGEPGWGVIYKTFFYKSKLLQRKQGGLFQRPSPKTSTSKTDLLHCRFCLLQSPPRLPPPEGGQRWRGENVPTHPLWEHRVVHRAR